jgi:hypothetical protein
MDEAMPGQRCCNTTVIAVAVCAAAALQDFQVFGYARTKMSDAEFRDMIASTLTCRIDARWGTGREHQ